MMTSCCDFYFLVAIVLVVFLPSNVSILCRDLLVMSRPLFLPIAFLLVATSVLRCNRFPPSHLFSRSRPQGDVATSFAVCLALLRVATSVSSHDIVCGLIIKWSHLQFSCQDFSNYFHVATYTACRDLNSNLSLKTSCNVFYLRRPLLWLSLTDPRCDLRVVLRHHLYPFGFMTSKCCHDMNFFL